MELTGRKALITGGDSGMGRAAAIAYAREGADVAINYFPSEEPDAREVIELIKAAGRTGIAIPGELTTAAASFKSEPRRVLVVDDTWVSGGSAQSVAAALKRSGARRVAIVVLGRQVNPADPRSAKFLAALSPGSVPPRHQGETITAAR